MAESIPAIPIHAVQPGDELFEASLADVVRRLPDKPSLTGLRRLSGGASQETWSLDILRAGICERLILRRAPGGTDQRRDMAAGLDKEASLIELAGQANVPVPRIVYVLTAEDGLGAGFLTEYVEAEAVPKRILRDAKFAAIRPALARKCGETLARIHAIAPAECPPLQIRTARQSLGQIEAQYRNQDIARPVFEYALRWLHEKLPPASEERMCLVHGDFRNGNLMIDEHGIAAVLDWELAHFGDPIEDLGWFCTPSWRFGELHKPAGGFGSIGEFIAGYRSAGGERVDRDRLFFWMILGSLYWGTICTEFALEFRRGDRAIERAATGRRASETELDILWLLESGNPLA